MIVVTTKKGTMDGKIHTSYSGFVNITIPVRELNVLSATDFREQKRGDDYGADTDWFDELTKVAVSHSHTLHRLHTIQCHIPGVRLHSQALTL